MNQKINPNPSSRSSSLSSSREAPKELRSCPRCKSNNTKFCYYNNYSLTQPRYFCKSCRRYWTEGGSLRNVPVGGGSRKSRKSTTATTTTVSCSSSSSSSDHFKNKNNNNARLPNYPSSQDLNVAFPCAMTHFVEVPKVVENMNNGYRGLSSFIPNLMPNSNNIDADLGYHFLPIGEFKPSLGINCVDGFGNGPNLVGFQQLNQSSCGEPNECDDHQKERQQGINISSGFWSGMLGGGSL